MSKRIIVTVPADPSKGVTVEVEGGAGAPCTSLTEKIEAALGAVTQRDLKDEYYQSSQDQDQRLLQ